MLKSFIGADMRLYERFGIGLHNNPDTQINWQINPVFMRVPRLKNKSDLKMTTKKSDIVRNNQK